MIYKNFDSLQYQSAITPKRSTVDVVSIKGNPLAVRQVRTPADLPGSSYARTDASVQRRVQTVVLLEFLAHDWAGANEAHVAQQHVPELRQFVQARLPNKAAKLSDARVILEFEGSLPFSLGSGVVLQQVTKYLIGVRHH